MSSDTLSRAMTRTEELVGILIKTSSFMMSDAPSYPLASGAKSRFYVDCRKAFSFPDARKLIGELIYEHIESDNVDAVGGLLFGASPIAIAVSDAAYRRGKLIRAFFVRKEAKMHGLQKVIEGDVRPGERVVIVDDVVTSGQSTIAAIQKSREEQLEVVKAIVLVDREEQGGRQAIEKEVPFEALCSLSQLAEYHERARSRA